MARKFERDLRRVCGARHPREADHRLGKVGEPFRSRDPDPRAAVYHQWVFPPADQAELIAWQRQVDAPRTFLVHGEEPVMHQFASKLKDTLAVTPEPGQEFEL